MLIKWLLRSHPALAESLRTQNLHQAPIISYTHAVERVTSKTAGYDCVNNATVRELKDGDSRTDHTRKGTTRIPGWHPEEAASQLPKHVAHKPWGGRPPCVQAR